MDKKNAKKRIQEVLSIVKLTGNEKYKISTYSKGMQQRLGLASALLTDPDLLFLDEPTSALDPIGRKEVRDIMVDLKRRGKTVLLNSHLLSEVEIVCDSVAIINKGSVIAQGSMADMLQSEEVIDIYAEDLSDDLIRELRNISPNIELKNNRIKMSVKNKEDVHKIASIIVQMGGKLYELIPQRQNLESKFISLVEGGEFK
jgi:ABC-2 type transport system ATP-binding protein